MTHEILLAGFGGQGILFAGKFLACEALLESREVSWLPSYGPEMRGGTCNCSVILSDTKIGSPIVSHPNILIAMNLPSLDKFEDAAVPGAKIFVDSSLAERRIKRTDVRAYYIPATKIASDEGLSGLANMIMIGCVIKNTGVIPYENVEKTMNKLVSGKKRGLIAPNIKAVELGYKY